MWRNGAKPRSSAALGLICSLSKVTSSVKVFLLHLCLDLLHLLQGFILENTKSRTDEILNYYWIWKMGNFRQNRKKKTFRNKYCKHARTHITGHVIPEKQYCFFSMLFTSLSELISNKLWQKQKQVCGVNAWCSIQTVNCSRTSQAEALTCRMFQLVVPQLVHDKATPLGSESRRFPSPRDSGQHLIWMCVYNWKCITEEMCTGSSGFRLTEGLES